MSGWSAEGRISATGWETASWASPAEVLPGVTAYPIDDVWLLEFNADLPPDPEPLIRTAGWALAESPRGVACRLPASLAEMADDSVEALASLGWHVRGWPGASIAISCRQANLRSRLRTAPGGHSLLFTGSLLSAWAMLAASPVQQTSTRVAPHPAALHQARQFLSRTCLDWRLQKAIIAGQQVLDELVLSAVCQTLDPLVVTLSRVDQALRIAVRVWTPPDNLLLQAEGVAWDTPLLDALGDSSGILSGADGSSVRWGVVQA
ncbi:hypothetical protein GCM10009841_08610 [Microlunatus panaciterrae]|uniref:GspL cytoplasmic actin-ATPase-like domain-containing protein n=1 Tax=Microlunatus panaciterrae TaxID=400768 RepID=A0ABS2RLF5_9ACTN|nr:hypothetical protein [Microlunatus panaciterrae]MBM7799407.1 hypothetical protein [Microlunatus panaciterrae]